MSLVNMRSLLKAADAGGWAAGSFSVANMECIRGVLNAAEELRDFVEKTSGVRLPIVVKGTGSGEWGTGNKAIVLEVDDHLSTKGNFF